MSTSPEPDAAPLASKEADAFEATDQNEPNDLAADLSDDESVLSDIDEAQFEDFDLAKVAIDERPQLAIDEENLKLVGRHKRRRTDEDEGGKQKRKKREGRREKKSRRKAQDSDEGFSGGDDTVARRSVKSRPKKVEEEVNEDELDPETRMACRSRLEFPRGALTDTILQAVAAL
jgi:transcription factor SPN1